MKTRKPFGILLTALCLSTLYLKVQAQAKEFEGLVVYKNSLTSKLPEVSDDAWKRYIFLSDTLTVFFRRGFYKETSPLLDVYFYPTEQKIYYKYKGIDSLFYLDYQYDTSNKVLNISPLAGSSTINNYQCKKLMVKTESNTTTYEYAPDLYLNPAYDASNTNNRYDAYIKEAKAVELKSITDRSYYNSSQYAVRIENKVLDDNVFALPNLPKTRYNYASIAKQPEFKGGPEGFSKFLQKNLNGNLGRDYVKIPKGETSASVLVKIRFVVTEDGKVTNVEVMNKKAVPSALSLDAISVIERLPNLKPATLNGKKIPYLFGCSVTYMNEK